MSKKNANGKRAVKDLPPRKGQDVKGGAVNAFLSFFDKADGES